MAKEQVLRFKPALRLEQIDDEHCERMQERDIIRDHAMILPDGATPKVDGIFGKDSIQKIAVQHRFQRLEVARDHRAQALVLEREDFLLVHRHTSFTRLRNPMTGIAVLRSCRERPRDSRAPEQRDELAPPHSITSSARASSVGGTVSRAPKVELVMPPIRYPLKNVYRVLEDRLSLAAPG